MTNGNNNDKLILIANGIGMAIDNDKFSLRCGATSSFDRLSEKEKKYILNIVSNKDFPDLDYLESNTDLAYLNLISMLAYRYFNGPKAKQKLDFHTDDLEILAKAINKFIYLIAESYNMVDVQNTPRLNTFFNGLKKTP